jgi:hypothetical protein
MKKLILHRQLASACERLDEQSDARERLTEDSRLLHDELESLRRREKAYSKMQRERDKLQHDFLTLKVSEETRMAEAARRIGGLLGVAF